MTTYFASILNWFKALFFSVELEVCVVGLQASGKTSFVNVISNGQWSEDVVPTVAFQLRRVKKGSVVLKIWDLAGQPKFRNMWERYCRGTQAIVFVVDASDRSSLPTATSELHSLLSMPTLKGVPLLVLANKNDLKDAMQVDVLIKEMGLSTVRGRAVSCYSTSMKTSHNIDVVLAWMTQRAHK